MSEVRTIVIVIMLVGLSLAAARLIIVPYSGFIEV